MNACLIRLGVSLFLVSVLFAQVERSGGSGALKAGAGGFEIPKQAMNAILVMRRDDGAALRISSGQCEVVGDSGFAAIS